MHRNIVLLAVGLMIAAVAPAIAQRPGGPSPAKRDGTEEMRKLQAEIEKLQAEIRETEAQIRKTQGGNPDRPTAPAKEPAPKERPADMGERRFGPGGFGPGGFGPGGFGRPFGQFEGRGGNDVKSLQAELDRLNEAGKMIAERIKDVSARLDKAKKAEEEARQKERAPKVPGTPGGSGARGPSDVEKRLDRIEQVLEEIQKELRKRK